MKLIISFMIFFVIIGNLWVVFYEFLIIKIIFYSYMDFIVRGYFFYGLNLRGDLG